MMNRSVCRLLVILLVLALVPLAPSPSQRVEAATITVTNLSDSGAGSLRQAIIDAAPGDTITFDVSGTITLTSTLTVDKQVSITGPASGAIVIDGNASGSVITITSSGNLTLNGLTITNGSNLFGGGIHNSGTLNLNRCSVINNVATGPGGGGLYGASGSTTVVTNSTLSGNRSEYFGGGAFIVGTATFQYTTITNNFSDFAGSGRESGGISVGSYGSATITATILSDNYGRETTNEFNCLAAGYPERVANGTLTSGGYNLVGDGCDMLTPLATDLMNTAPRVDSLASNGGPTQTHALQPTSGAIDKVPQAVCTQTVDQRGIARDTNCDTGAYEYVAPVPEFTSVGPGVGNEGDTITIDAAMTVPAGQSTDLVIDWGDGSTPDSTTYSEGTHTLTPGHRYADDNPTATAADTYTVNLSLVNGATTHDTTSTTVTVNNLAPTLTSPGDQFVAVGEALDLTNVFTFTDPGYNTETFTYSIDWGDGSALESGAVTNVTNGSAGVATSGAFGSTHTYTDIAGSPYTVTATVTDDDTGMDTVTFTATVTVQPLTVSKTFDGGATSHVRPGEPSILTLSFTNPNASLLLTGLTFTDDLPAGLTVVTPGIAVGTCAPSGATFDVRVTETQITPFTSTVPAGDVCTVDIPVSASVEGTYVNTITGISTLEGGVSSSDTATLQVTNAVVFTKAFDPVAVLVGQEALLTVTIENLNASLDATNVAFSDVLPADVVLVAGSAASDPASSCGGTLSDAANTLSLSGGTVAHGESCVITARVIAVTPGTITNQFTSAASDLPDNNSTDTAILTVTQSGPGPTPSPTPDPNGPTPTPDPNAPTSTPTGPVYTAADHARAQAPLCQDLDGSTNPVVRADVQAGTVTNGGVYCRVLAQDGEYVTGPGEVGDPTVIALGVIQAVDVFGMAGQTSVPFFNASVKVCLKGSGRMFYLNATTAPRQLSLVSTALEGGYTCGRITNAGTIVLVP